VHLRHLVLAVMTVDREPQYVHQTLASLLAADDLVHELGAVHLVIGCSEACYLEVYRHHKMLVFHPLSVEEDAGIQDWSVHRRFCHNYVRCLSLPIPEDGGICICEDDIVLRDSFLQRLLLTIHEMEDEAGLRDYCLSLFADADFEANASFYRGRYYCSYGTGFHGTQCMYYPAPVAERLRDHIQQYGVDEPTRPGDILIAELHGDRMYASSRSLADHIGSVSTGLGGCKSSPSFSRPFRAIPREEWGQRA